MSLTTGRGPLSPDPAGRFVDATTYVEPFLRRIRGFKGGEAVVDSQRVLLVHRSGHPTSWAFPPGDVHLPADEEPAAPGHVRVAWDAVDEWWEEGQRFPGNYPRNPYHRVDCLPGQRRLRVELGGVTLVDTTDTTGVFETALLPKLYVARSHVHAELEPSDTRTWCSYKGVASYWNIAGVEDVAWSYEAPLSESAPIAGLLAFDGAKATVEEDVPRGS